MVDKFLRFDFGKRTVFKVSFDIDIEEGSVSADTHRRAVLIFNRAEVAEIKPLDCFACVCGGAGNVETVF